MSETEEILRSNMEKTLAFVEEQCEEGEKKDYLLAILNRLEKEPFWFDKIAKVNKFREAMRESANEEG